MLAYDREVAQLLWQAHKMENENIQNTNEALSKLFLSIIGVNCKKGVESDLIGQTNSSFFKNFGIFLTKYEKYGPLDLEHNKLKMLSEWDPEIPIKALFQQINNAAEFAIYVNQPHCQQQ